MCINYVRCFPHNFLFVVSHYFFNVLDSIKPNRLRFMFYVGHWIECIASKYIMIHMWNVRKWNWCRRCHLSTVVWENKVVESNSVSRKKSTAIATLLCNSSHVYTICKRVVNAHSNWVSNFSFILIHILSTAIMKWTTHYIIQLVTDIRKWQPSSINECMFMNIQKEHRRDNMA